MWLAVKLGFKAYIFDLDGCVYRSDEPLPGAREAIERLREKGRKILFLTNNSTGTPRGYAEKLTGIGIEATPEDVLTSSEAMAIHMRRLERGRVYVIGEEALVEAISREGFEIVGEEGAPQARYVVSGLDRGLTYGKLSAACSAIFNGAIYLATNTDPVLPTKAGFFPGAGAISSMIRGVTGVRPRVIGKPSKWIISLALSRMGVVAREAAIVGDSVETDIVAGRNSGLFTILISAGYPNDKSSRRKIRPDLTLRSLRDLLQHI